MRLQLQDCDPEVDASHGQVKDCGSKICIFDN